VTEPVWLRRDVILAVHDEQLAEHGGAHGLRDGGLLDSALARPQHLLSYGDPDVSELAAAYGWGIARNHPFVDGNKRTALVAAELFLVLNGYELQADDADCVVTMLSVAAGEMAEDDFAAWIRGHIRRRG
jgi:death-on-curing protein